jgi:hypothetical protein
MKDINTVKHFDTLEKLVQVLCKKTQNDDPKFFRILVAYYFTKLASMMRVSVNTHDKGKLPVNFYGINLASSGYGKGHATNIVEENVINEFKERYLENTFKIISEANLAKVANKRAVQSSSDPDDELERVTKEFEQAGELLFSFDSATTAAVKQMRHKLLMANAGSMNMEIDEIGSKLLGNVDVLTAFLELYDVGKIKPKLVKNTADNTRSKEIDGRTPANLLLFGTPSKLLDGGKTEAEFDTMLETGYARRCFFGYSKTGAQMEDLTPQEIYDRLTDKSSVTYLDDLSDELANLADIMNFEAVIEMTKDVSLLLFEYYGECKKKANQLSDYEEIKKAEMTHRYFKTVKLAATYAFIDGKEVMEEDHLYAAIKLVEESGEAFSQILTRDRAYAKLAHYIATVGREVTHVDLVEDLPFYRGSEAQKRELMTLAIAYGYKNNIIIKKNFTDGIEFLKGEALQEINTDRVIVSYSTELAANYHNDTVKFEEMDKLTQADGYHWTAHHLLDGYRKEENCISGFNLIVLDVDDGVSMDTAQLLLADYKYHMYTTKRHTAQDNRFRVVLPMSHTLKMDATEFKAFMANVFEWLPFGVDSQTNQRARKWLSHTGVSIFNDGELLDVLPFIPKTTKNEERKQIISDQQSLSNIERWFINNTGEGNRSNQLVKYALLLVDSGMDIDSIRNNVMALNSKLPNKLDETEVMSTILVSATRAMHKRDTES